MRYIENKVKQEQQSFQSFINPVDLVGKIKLISLSSGMKGEEKVTIDLLTF